MSCSEPSQRRAKRRSLVEVFILESPDQVAAVAADFVIAALSGSPSPVFGIATGSSPLGVYRELAARAKRGDVDFSTTRAFALDEYCGLPAEHPQSYHSVIARAVADPLGMSPALVSVPDGQADDLDWACERYEQEIAAAGGVDIQLLGIGANGHIGFNEPISSLASRTRVKTLTAQTRAANSRFFGSVDNVPTHCLTQGIGTILDARELLLVAQGSDKAAAVASAVEGPLTSLCPASALQLHPRATVVIDEAAASMLALGDYYREVQQLRHAVVGHTGRATARRTR